METDSKNRSNRELSRLYSRFRVLNREFGFSFGIKMDERIKRRSYQTNTVCSFGSAFPFKHTAPARAVKRRLGIAAAEGGV